MGGVGEEGVGFWGDCSDGIGVVGVDLELGSRKVGVDGVGDTGVSDTGVSISSDVSGGCTS